MSSIVIERESTRTSPAMLDIGRVDARVGIRPRSVRDRQPVGGRVVVRRELTWATADVRVRRVVGGVPEDFSTALVFSAGASGSLELPADEIRGDVEVEVLADSIEAGGMVSVVFEFDYPAEEASGISHQGSGIGNQPFVMSN
jgi:hypothetical protein